MMIHEKVIIRIHDAVNCSSNAWEIAKIYINTYAIYCIGVTSLTVFVLLWRKICFKSNYTTYIYNLI